MDSSEIIRRLKKIAEYAVHVPGRGPYIMSIDDGNALHEAAEILEERERIRKWNENILIDGVKLVRIIPENVSMMQNMKLYLDYTKDEMADVISKFIMKDEFIERLKSECDKGNVRIEAIVKFTKEWM